MPRRRDSAMALAHRAVLQLFDRHKAPSELAEFTFRLAQQAHARELLAALLHEGDDGLPFSSVTDARRVGEVVAYAHDVHGVLPPHVCARVRQWTRFRAWMDEQDSGCRMESRIHAVGTPPTP